ncbi:MAG: MCE family protein [Gemmatimonadota bacterium]|nr:MAG: MCE family protein [Gemmatimonadota bacterium]
MKRRDELIVGFTILIALAIVVAGAFWLSQTQLRSGGFFQSVRFRTVGGLGAGSPVVLRGVRVGRVRQIRIAESEWVETDLQIYEGAPVPERPAVIAASASLFGEWQAQIIDLNNPPDDPIVRRELFDALEAGGDVWPGATLPDIGQLTAQGARIATDIATVSSRIQTAFDSQTVQDMQRSIRDFGQMADTLTRFTEQQTVVFGEVSSNIKQGSDVVTAAVLSLERAMARLDSATAGGELDSIFASVQGATQHVRDAVGSFLTLVQLAEENQASFVSVLVGADSVMTRMQNMTGTLGLLVGDSTLYNEAASTVAELRALLADIKANPRKYFKFSVF